MIKKIKLCNVQDRFRPILCTQKLLKNLLELNHLTSTFQLNFGQFLETCEISMKIALKYFLIGSNWGQKATTKDRKTKEKCALEGVE
jgi:hypothetical protein